MKKIILINIICLVNYSLCAQELSKQIVQKEKYTHVNINNKSTIAQNVNEAFNKLDKAYTLDFTHSISKKNLTELKNVTALKVSNAEYIEYENTSAIAELLNTAPEVLIVKFPFKGSTIIVDLVKSNFIGDNFKINSNNPEKVANVKLGLYYKGVIRGEKSVAGFSFFENEFSALLSSDKKENGIVEIGHLPNKNEESRTHIIYADADLKISLGKPCLAETLPQYKTALSGINTETMINLEKNSKDLSSATTSNAASPLKCVTYFWETSFSYYQALNNNAQSVSNHATAIFNNFQIIFSNESIGSKLNQLFIWTSADPYADNLQTFSSTRLNFGANLATLLSATGGGGLAYVNTICQSSDLYRHSFCGSILLDAINPFPIYNWGVYVTTHEVGHNLGSPHTHDCSWNGNNTAIDGCGPAAGYSSGCNAPVPPANVGGTIMSYCHLLNNSGVNFVNGFGPQPGNILRNNVNSCITLICGSACPTNLTITQNITAAGTYSASNSLTNTFSATNNTNVNQSILFTAGNQILFEPGFFASNVSIGEIEARIAPCIGAVTNASGQATGVTTSIASLNTTNSLAEIKTSIYNGNMFVMPNPFDQTLSLQYLITDKDKRARIEIFSITGKKVATLFERNIIKSGVYKLNWDASNLTSGTYVVKLVTDNGIQTIKVIK
jgi:Metallo-peptidase family M12/Secretion system C-terminal sorting domain